MRDTNAPNLASRVQKQHTIDECECAVRVAGVFCDKSAINPEHGTAGDVLLRAGHVPRTARQPRRVRFVAVLDSHSALYVQPVLLDQALRRYGHCSSSAHVAFTYTLMLELPPDRCDIIPVRDRVVLRACLKQVTGPRDRRLVLVQQLWTTLAVSDPWPLACWFVHWHRRFHWCGVPSARQLTFLLKLLLEPTTVTSEKLTPS